MPGSVLKSISYLYILQAVGQLLPLITVPYLLRTLGLSVFGEIQMAASFAAIGSQFTDWGFGFSGTRSIAKLKDNAEVISYFIVNSIATKCVLFFAWTILSLYIYIYYVTSSYYLITLMIVLSNTFAPHWIFQGLEKFAEASIISILVRITFTCLIFILVTQDDAKYVLILSVISGAVISLLLWLRLPSVRQLRLSMVSTPAIRRVLIDGSEVFFTTMAIGWYTSGALIIVGLMGGRMQLVFMLYQKK